MFHVPDLPPGYSVREGDQVEHFRALPVRRFCVLSISTNGSGDGSALVHPVGPFVVDYVTAYDSGGNLTVWRCYWENNRGSTTDFLAKAVNETKVYPRASTIFTTATDLYLQSPWNMVLREDDRRTFRVSGGLTSGTVELTLLVRELQKVARPEAGFVEVPAATAEA